MLLFRSSSAFRIHQSDPRRHLFAESDLPTVMLKKIQILLRRPLMLEADACDLQDPGSDAADKRSFVLHKIRGDQKAAGL